jgi:hypothetical protein
VTVFTDSTPAWNVLKEVEFASLLLTDLHFPHPQPHGMAVAPSRKKVES